MSDHHATHHSPAGNTPTAGNRTGLLGPILNLWHLMGAEVVAEIAGTAGYEAIRKLINKVSGKNILTNPHEPHDAHHAPPAPVQSGSIHVDPEGKGAGDEQAFMQDLGAIDGRCGVNTAEYQALRKWLAGKSSKYRAHFRNGHLLEKDKPQRLRNLAKLAKLPDDAARDEHAKAAGHEEPVNHAAHEWHKIVHLYEHKIIPGMRRANASLRRFEHQQRQDNPGIARAREGRIGIGWFSVKFDMFKMR